MRAPPILAIGLLVSFLALSAGCGEDDGEGGPCGGSDATMRPGENCLACHGNFRAAGTVYASVSAGQCDGISGATVTLTDDVGTVVTRTTNSAGNFYTTQALVFPVQISVTAGGQTVQMANAANGACNTCHVDAFRIHVP